MFLLILFIPIYILILLIVPLAIVIICFFLMTILIICRFFLSRINQMFSLTLYAYIQTQFGLSIKALQCDNDREYDNAPFTEFSHTHGIIWRHSCPNKSPQNGKAERMIRTINNVCRSLLFHASLPPSYWVESLHMATYLLIIRPTRVLHNLTPMHILDNKAPSYDHLRTFGYLCYPNLSSTTTHKMSPRSTPCIFLGYPLNHRGYRCLNLATHKVIISRHVNFDEFAFPNSSQYTPTPSDYEFLGAATGPNPPPPLIYNSAAQPRVDPGLTPALPPTGPVSPPCTPHNLHHSPASLGRVSCMGLLPSLWLLLLFPLAQMPLPLLPCLLARLLA